MAGFPTPADQGYGATTKKETNGGVIGGSGLAMAAEYNAGAAAPQHTQQQQFGQTNRAAALAK